MKAFAHEVKHAARGIAAQPGFSLLVVGVLTAALTCVIYVLIAIGSLILRPLPFPDAHLLHHVGISERSGDQLEPLRADDLLQLRRQLSGSALVAGITPATINLSDLDKPERFNGAFVSSNLFAVLGVAPMLGRDFVQTDERDGAAPVVMLSHALWQGRYGSDSGVIGRQIRVNSQPATIVGVMPPDFSYPRRETIWSVGRFVEGAPVDLTYTAVLRRAAGVDTPTVATAVAAWFADAARADPERMRGSRVGLEPLAHFTVNRTTRMVVAVMLVAVVLVLLVACANVANLLLTRTLSRRQELAIRVALGASRGRMILHLMAQSLLLTMIAVAIAVPLASAAAEWTERAFRTAEDGPPHWLHFTLDAGIVWMTLGVALLTALVAGILPALRAGSAALAGDLRDGTRGATGGGFARVSRVLVIGEIAFSCALLIAVGTLVRGIGSLERTDSGIDPAGILTARVGLFTNTYPTGAEQIQLFERLVERLRADPAVIDATAATGLPGIGRSRRAYVAEGQVVGDGPLPQLHMAAVDDRFLDAYQLRLRDGRFFDSRDGADALAVAVVDRRFAELHAPAGEVIGQRFRLDPRREDGPVVTVVGVIDALRMTEPGATQRPAMLVPMRQQPARFASLAMRVHGDPVAFAPRLAELMREVDADTPAYWVRSYAQWLREVTFDERLLAGVFSIFGLIALALAGAGLYGVMAFNVGQRTREIGVRRALGARSSSVLADVARRVATQLAIGLVLGLGFGIPFARALSAIVNSIEQSGAVVILGALGVLIAAAFLAVIVPARRALRVDPMVALRHE